MFILGDIFFKVELPFKSVDFGPIAVEKWCCFKNLSVHCWLQDTECGRDKLPPYNSASFHAFVKTGTFFSCAAGQKELVLARCVHEKRFSITCWMLRRWHSTLTFQRLCSTASWTSATATKNAKLIGSAKSERCIKRFCDLGM